MRRKNLSKEDIANVNAMTQAGVLSPEAAVQMLAFGMKKGQEVRAQQALIAQAQAQAEAARTNPPQFYDKPTMNKQRVQERNEQIALYANLARSGRPEDASLAEQMLPLLLAEEEAYRTAVREGRTRYNPAKVAGTNWVVEVTPDYVGYTYSKTSRGPVFAQVLLFYPETHSGVEAPLPGLPPPVPGRPYKTRGQIEVYGPQGSVPESQIFPLSVSGMQAAAQWLATFGLPPPPWKKSDVRGNSSPSPAEQAALPVGPLEQDMMQMDKSHPFEYRSMFSRLKKMIRPEDLAEAAALRAISKRGRAGLLSPAEEDDWEKRNWQLYREHPIHKYLAQTGAIARDQKRARQVSELQARIWELKQHVPQYRDQDPVGSFMDVCLINTKYEWSVGLPDHALAPGGIGRYNSSPSPAEQAASQYAALFGQPARVLDAGRILAWEDRSAALAAGGPPRAGSWGGSPSIYRVDADFLSRLTWLAKKPDRGSHRDMQHALAPWFEGFQKEGRRRPKA